jgi:hypothetical protein
MLARIFSWPRLALTGNLSEPSKEVCEPAYWELAARFLYAAALDEGKGKAHPEETGELKGGVASTSLDNKCPLCGLPAK